MGRKSITGGVTPAGPNRIQFDLHIDGVRLRPTLPWVPNEANLRRARATFARMKAQIAAGTFCFADEFPRFKGLSRLPPPFRSRTCGQIFDGFLLHLERQLQLRESAMRAGLVKHDHLFFTDTGTPIRSLGYGYWRWQRS